MEDEIEALEQRIDSLEGEIDKLRGLVLASAKALAFALGEIAKEAKVSSQTGIYSGAFHGSEEQRFISQVHDAYFSALQD